MLDEMEEEADRARWLCGVGSGPVFANGPGAAGQASTPIQELDEDRYFSERIDESRNSVDMDSDGEIGPPHASDSDWRSLYT
jgi:hypothetical protein